MAPDDLRLVEWCGQIAFLGKKLKYLAARDFGANVPKPDRWLAVWPNIWEKE